MSIRFGFSTGKHSPISAIIRWATKLKTSHTFLLFLTGCHFCTDTVAGQGVCIVYGASAVGGITDGVVGAAWANGSVKPGGPDSTACPVGYTCTIVQDAGPDGGVDAGPSSVPRSGEVGGL